VAADTDIREWARARGMSVGERGRLPRDVQDAYAAENGDETVPRDSAEITELPTETAPLETRATGERPPGKAARKEPWWKRFTSGKVRRRASLETLGTVGYSIAAHVARTNGMVSVSRVLEWQSPVAGVVVDTALKGTIVDKVLQPIARAGERGEALAAMLGVPLLVAAISANPKRAPMLLPVLKVALIHWATVAAPAMKTLEQRQKKLQEALGDFDPDALIAAIFAPDEGGPDASDSFPDAA